MSASLNRVFLIGNVTRDPEVRAIEGGTMVTKIGLAMNSKNRKGEDVVTFLDVVLWDKLAERAGKYLKKGMSVHIEGRIAVRQYETKDGDKRTATEIVANSMQMLTPRQAGAPADTGSAEDEPDEFDIEGDS